MTGRPGGLTGAAAANRAGWDRKSDEYQELNGRFIGGGMAWGVWQIPEDELGVLGEVAGARMLELGCGAAQWSIALARRDAIPVGLDLSSRQLAHARRQVQAAGVEVALVLGSGEAVPFADDSFDVVFCDYGAMTFGDPYRTVPQAARVLRPGGLLAFSTGSPIVEMCWSEAEDRIATNLINDYFEMHEIQEDDGMVSFMLPYGEWIRLFRSNGFVVEDLIEPRPDSDAISTYRDDTDRVWHRRWPGESIWRVRLES